MKYGLKTQSSDLGDFLCCTTIVDYDNENVANLSGQLFSKSESVVDFVRIVYEYVGFAWTLAAINPVSLPNFRSTTNNWPIPPELIKESVMSRQSLPNPTSTSLTP